MAKPHDRRLVPGLKALLARPGRRVQAGYHHIRRLPGGAWREERLDCSLCGTALRIWGPDPFATVTTRKVTEKPGQVILVRDVPQAYVTTAAYAEVALLLEGPEGRRGKHEAAVCRGCKARLTDDQVEDLYLAELEQLAMDDEMRGADVTTSRKTLATMASYRAVRVLRDEEA